MPAATAREAPTTREVAETLGVAETELEAFVRQREEPTAAAVAGWALAPPSALEDVRRWVEE